MSFGNREEARADYLKDIKYWTFVGEYFVWVEFDDNDIVEIEEKAKIRDNSNARSQKNYAKGSSLNGHIHGLAGEMAVKKTYCPEVPLCATHKPDGSRHVGDVNGWEIKSTSYGKFWKIFVNESTLKTERIYILVMTHYYPYCAAIMGWCYGHTIVEKGELIQPEFRDREKAYFMSWQYLNRMENDE